MKLSFEQLKTIVSAYIVENKISIDTFEVTRDNTALLVDKIAKIFTLDTSFTDKLAEFEGEELSFGKTIEEWQQDLMLPEEYQADGTGALAPHDPTYRPAFYSYTLGRKVIPTTIRNNDIERAVHFVEQFTELISMKTKRLYDSVAVWRYGVKREMLARLIEMCDNVEDGAEAYATNKSFAVGDYISGGSPTIYGVVVKPITASASDTNTWAKVLAGGYAIPLNLVEEVSIPSDTASGEEFIKSVKKDVEISQDISEGHSLNGNTLGASSGLVLLVKQGVMPVIDVDVIAGAFHEQKVAVPAEVKVIKDFGSDDTDVFAILLDRRGLRLHNTYRAVRENFNGAGDYLNLFYHSEDTAFISRNTFVKIYRKKSA
ncbi:MAG: hypothetical protein J6T10_20440 [Methanobrevibacter sp.]|nr:hypothetical protein [Methanobrevibacter sp.]